jgi:cytoskeletal protein CcmA (bactofilin family)
VNIEGLFLIALFLALLALPLVPGIRELVRPRDDRPLEIDVDATLDPRQPGRSFREALAPFRARAGSEVPFRAPMDLEQPSGDAYEVHRDLLLPPGGHGPALTIVLGKADVGERARLGELYIQDTGRLAAGVRVRAVATDADLQLGPACVVEQWLDVEGMADVGAGSKLGHQASAAGRLRLGAGCSFRRLWGLPVSTAAGGPVPEGTDSPPPDESGTKLDDVVLWVGRQLTMPRGLTLDRDLVVHGEVRVSSGNHVRGSIKAYGRLHLAKGVEVDGNLICRRSIHIDGQAQIRGNVFSEGDIVIGPGTTIGAAGGFKSVYALGRVELAADVQVFGWIVTEGVGVVSGPLDGSNGAPGVDNRAVASRSS